jgi:very-short-patch-repair endonuclease
MTSTAQVTSMPTDARVAWEAAKQHGVVDRAQLLTCGVSRAGVERRIAAGWLYRMHRGVYAVGHPGLSRHGGWMAAVLSGGHGAALSHRSAAALWGIGHDGRVPSITIPGTKRVGTAGLEVHAGLLRSDEIVIFDDIPVTSVGRTLLDLAEILTVEQLVPIIDNATNSRRLGRNTMSSVINAAPGRRGRKTLKRALLMTRPEDVLTRSELERRALRLVGRPAPEMNVRLHGYEVDMLWRGERLVVELDGSAYHDPEHDTRKTNNLMARGWTVLRFTWRQVVNDQTWVVGSLQAVRSRAACLASPSSSA